MVHEACRSAPHLLPRQAYGGRAGSLPIAWEEVEERELQKAT